MLRIGVPCSLCRKVIWRFWGGDQKNVTFLTIVKIFDTKVSNYLTLPIVFGHCHVKIQG